MLNVYDGNNVLIRALTDKSLHAGSSMNLRLRYNQATPTDIWVFDGFGHNERRRAIFPAYKAQRKPQEMDLMAQIKLFKQLIRHSPATLIEVEGWEADDVIHTLARKGAPMRVHSNDFDYHQLARYPNVTLVGVKNKADISPRWLPLYKALVGDPSDNIPGIPGFGPKAWESLLPHVENFERAIQNGKPAVFEVFPLAPRIKTWLLSQDNVQQLQQLLLITHMFVVPDAEIERGIIRGTPNPAEARALLTRYLL